MIQSSSCIAQNVDLKKTEIDRQAFSSGYAWKNGDIVIVSSTLTTTGLGKLEWNIFLLDSELKQKKKITVCSAEYEFMGAICDTGTKANGFFMFSGPKDHKIFKFNDQLESAGDFSCKKNNPDEQIKKFANVNSNIIISGNGFEKGSKSVGEVFCYIISTKGGDTYRYVNKDKKSSFLEMLIDSTSNNVHLFLEAGNEIRKEINVISLNDKGIIKKSSADFRGARITEIQSLKATILPDKRIFAITSVVESRKSDSNRVILCKSIFNENENPDFTLLKLKNSNNEELTTINQKKNGSWNASYSEDRTVNNLSFIGWNNNQLLVSNVMAIRRFELSSYAYTYGFGNILSFSHEGVLQSFNTYLEDLNFSQTFPDLINRFSFQCINNEIYMFKTVSTGENKNAFNYNYQKKTSFINIAGTFYKIYVQKLSESNNLLFRKSTELMESSGLTDTPKQVQLKDGFLILSSTVKLNSETKEVAKIKLDVIKISNSFLKNQ